MFQRAGLCCAALMISIICSSAAIAGWQTQYQEAPHQFLGNRWHRSVGYDASTGQFLITYSGDHLYLARGNQDQWSIEVADASLGAGGASSLL